MIGLGLRRVRVGWVMGESPAARPAPTASTWVVLLVTGALLLCCCGGLFLFVSGLGWEVRP